MPELKLCPFCGGKAIVEGHHNRFMEWKAFGVAAALTACIAMTGCAGTGVGRDYSPKYPVLRYRNSEYNMDPYNREIPVQNGYILDEGNSYEVVETDSGYDLVLHFVKGDSDDEA
jgi:hypothetical protein